MASRSSIRFKKQVAANSPSPCAMSQRPFLRPVADDKQANFGAVRSYESNVHNDFGARYARRPTTVPWSLASGVIGNVPQGPQCMAAPLHWPARSKAASNITWENRTIIQDIMKPISRQLPYSTRPLPARLPAYAASSPAFITPMSFRS